MLSQFSSLNRTRSSSMSVAVMTVVKPRCQPTKMISPGAYPRIFFSAHQLMEVQSCLWIFWMYSSRREIQSLRSWKTRSASGRRVMIPLYRLRFRTLCIRSRVSQRVWGYSVTALSFTTMKHFWMACHPTAVRATSSTISVLSTPGLMLSFKPLNRLKAVVGMLTTPCRVPHRCLFRMSPVMSLPVMDAHLSKKPKATCRVRNLTLQVKSARHLF